MSIPDEMSEADGRFREDVLMEQDLEERRESGEREEWIRRSLDYLTETCGEQPWNDAKPENSEIGSERKAS